MKFQLFLNPWACLIFDVPSGSSKREPKAGFPRLFGAENAGSQAPNVEGKMVGTQRSSLEMGSSISCFGVLVGQFKIFE